MKSPRRKVAFVRILLILFTSFLFLSSCGTESIKDDTRYLRVALANTVGSEETLYIRFFKDGAPAGMDELVLPRHEPYIFDSIPVGEDFFPENHLKADSIVMYFGNKSLCVHHELAKVDDFQVNLRNIFKQTTWYRTDPFPLRETPEEDEDLDLRDYIYNFTGSQSLIATPCQGN